MNNCILQYQGLEKIASGTVQSLQSTSTKNISKRNFLDEKVFFSKTNTFSKLHDKSKIIPLITGIQQKFLNISA